MTPRCSIRSCVGFLLFYLHSDTVANDLGTKLKTRTLLYILFFFMYPECNSSSRDRLISGIIKIRSVARFCCIATVLSFLSERVRTLSLVFVCFFICLFILVSIRSTKSSTEHPDENLSAVGQSQSRWRFIGVQVLQ